MARLGYLANSSNDYPRASESVIQGLEGWNRVWIYAPYCILVGVAIVGIAGRKVFDR